jgi:hypothetical protein
MQDDSAHSAKYGLDHRFGQQVDFGGSEST